MGGLTRTGAILAAPIAIRRRCQGATKRRIGGTLQTGRTLRRNSIRRTGAACVAVSARCVAPWTPADGAANRVSVSLLVDASGPQPPTESSLRVGPVRCPDSEAATARRRRPHGSASPIARSRADDGVRVGTPTRWPHRTPTPHASPPCSRVDHRGHLTR